MSYGLLAFMDRVVGIAKVAAASLDDVAGQAARAGTKAVGVVIDDTAVTPNYAVGFAAERELPIIGRIAIGSLINKLVFLLPIALLLSTYAPAWSITALLMAGGAYLCFEGAEKLFEVIFHHSADEDVVDAAVDAAVDAVLVDVVDAVTDDAQALEKEKVAGAIRTDFILSAEIMAITLATVAEETSSFWNQALVLAAVGVGITFLVYGVVAIIVKADDVGLALARNARPVSSLFGLRAVTGEPNVADRAIARITQGFGRGVVRAMPVVLNVLGGVGTAAMLWVGGGIVLHGLATFGVTVFEHPIHAVTELAVHAVPSAAAEAIAWLVGAVGAGIFGVVLGGAAVALMHLVTALLPKKA